MRIVDSYGINDGGLIFSVELAEDRFVDVKVCGGNQDGLVYVMQNEDGSTVIDGGWPYGTYSGFEYDEKASLKLVTETLKEFGRECVGDDGMFPMPSFLKDLRDKVASGRMTVQDAAFELGRERWTTVYSAETTRALLQLPREHIRVAIESTWDQAEPNFHPEMVRNENGEFEIRQFYRIVCMNELCGLGDLFSVADDRVFESEGAAVAAVQAESNMILVGYEELKKEAIDYLCGKPFKPETQDKAVVAEVLAEATQRSGAARERTSEMCEKAR